MVTARSSSAGEGKTEMVLQLWSKLNWRGHTAQQLIVDDQRGVALRRV